MLQVYTITYIILKIYECDEAKAPEGEAQNAAGANKKQKRACLRQASALSMIDVCCTLYRRNRGSNRKD